MDERLKEAAKYGNIDSLYKLIDENPSLLDHVDEKPLAHTPLHVAAFAGQTPFAREIMRLKPSFAKKLNEDGFSPMHLALQNGQTHHLVLQLLQVDKDLVCVKGREGMTPLHCAAKAGETHILLSFLNACPKSVEDVTNRNETALHVALNSGMFQAFELLVGWLKEGCHKEVHYRQREVLNWKDEDGNTVLHIAASRNIPQALRILVKCRVDVKLKNLQGLTALDIINGQAQSENREIIDMIGRSGALDVSLFPPVDYFGYYLRPDQWLKSAAQKGDVDALYAIIQEEPYILEHIDQVPFNDTPLHIAASAGHAPFAKEIMRLKPSFAKKLNEYGFSPVHLALQNGQTHLVVQLLNVDQDLVCIKGRDGMTPLHCAAKVGEKNLLVSFLKACPKSIEDVTIRNETALHVALNSGMFQAFEVLVGWLKEGCHEEAQYYRERKVLNWKDEDGNTVLHIAASKNIHQALEILVNSRVDVKSKNLQGLTALDILNDQAQSENREIIARIGESGASDVSLFPPVDYFGFYLRPYQWLRSAAQKNDVDVLYAIIWEEPHILEHIDQVPFEDTPLHIAASEGHTQFALEIMKLKPSFARKLNRDGFSPIHLALQNNHCQTVRRLIDTDGTLVRVKGRKGLTPLHYTAEKGMIDLLAVFLIACPGSIQDLTIHKESALHIAAKNDKVEALEVLVGWLEHVGKNKVLDWTDDEGNTVLHIASLRNQMQVVRMLTEPADLPLAFKALLPRWFGPKVDLNAKNTTGSTAVDILQNQGQLNRGKIGHLQLLAKVTKAPSFPGVSGHADYLRRRISCLEKWAIAIYLEKLLMSNATRNAVLVVAILIATATYQAVLSPPGGLSFPIPTSFYTFGSFSGGGGNTTGWYPNATTTNTTTLNTIDLRGDLIYSSPTSSFKDLFFCTLFITFNTIAFVMSIIKMVTLLPNGSFFVHPLTMPLLLCYCLSITNISPGVTSFMVGLFILPAAFFMAKSAFETWVFARRRRTMEQLLMTQRQELLQKESKHGSEL